MPTYEVRRRTVMTVAIVTAANPTEARFMDDVQRELVRRNSIVIALEESL